MSQSGHSFYSGDGEPNPCKFPCQFQQVVAQFFRDHSRLVAKWPLPFLVFPIAFTAVLGFAFVSHLDTVNDQGTDKLGMFLPDDVDSIKNLQRLAQVFPPKNALRDSYNMFGMNFAYAILEDASEERNVLRNDILKIANDIDKRVKSIRIQFGWYEASLRKLCFKDPNGNCLQHPVIDMLNTSDPLGASKFLLRYPELRFGNETIDNALIFGGVDVDSNSPADPNGNRKIVRAAALRLPYVLALAETDEESVIHSHWQHAFLDLVSRLQYRGVNIYYTAAVSWSAEIERNGVLIIPYMPVLFMVLVTFSVYSCMTADWVASKPCLALCGIFNALFAVVAAMGTLVYVGYPFLQMVFIMPFLILSISVDNMFLMLNSWRTTHPLQSVEERMSKAVGETAVSIMITALTDGLSFSVGSMSQFLAVRTFCTYCALAILYVFLYQVTFFTACMALTGRREAANRHCITCHKTLPKTDCGIGNKSLFYRLFCAGGYRTSRGSQRTIPLKLDEPFLSEFFSTTYADFLCLSTVKAAVVFGYLMYVCLAVYGLMQLPLGLDLRLLAPTNSYAAAELDASQRLFYAYGGFSFAVIEGTEVPYHDRSVARRLLQLYVDLSQNELAAPADFWLQDLHNNVQVSTNEVQFLQQLHHFLKQPNNIKYQSDLVFDEKTGQIAASKMLVRARNVGVVNNTRRAHLLRTTFANYSFPGFVYDASFLIVDQQTSTLENVVQNVGIAVGVMIVISLLFIPKLISAIWIGVSILSINVGVVGGLAMWNVRLDIVVMITIVMSIGFSVDYAAHITYHFLVSRDGEKRLHRAFKYVGLPIWQSAASTALGVITLIPVEAYMVRVFVKTVLLVAAIGVVHAMVFLPVFLSICVPADEYLVGLNIYGEKIGNYLATRMPRYIHQIRNKRMHCYLERPPDGDTIQSGQDALRAPSSRATTSSIEYSQQDATLHQSNNHFQQLHIRAPVEQGRPVHRRFGHKNSSRHRISKRQVRPVENVVADRASSKDLYDFLNYKARQQQCDEWTDGHSSPDAKLESEYTEVAAVPAVPIRGVFALNLHAKGDTTSDEECSTSSSIKESEYGPRRNTSSNGSSDHPLIDAGYVTGMLPDSVLPSIGVVDLGNAPQSSSHIARPAHKAPNPPTRRQSAPHYSRKQKRRSPRRVCSTADEEDVCSSQRSHQTPSPKVKPPVPPRAETVSIMVQQLRQAQAERKDVNKRLKAIGSFDDVTSTAPTEADSDVFGVIGAGKNAPKRELTTFKAGRGAKRHGGTTVHSYRI